VTASAAARAIAQDRIETFTARLEYADRQIIEMGGSDTAAAAVASGAVEGGGGAATDAAGEGGAAAGAAAAGASVAGVEDEAEAALGLSRMSSLDDAKPVILVRSARVAEAHARHPDTDSIHAHARAVGVGPLLHGN
jgi:hypothetical protein